MFKFTSFTPKANEAINLAMAQASLLGHTYIGSEHILLGLLLEGSGVAYSILIYKKVTMEMVLDILIKTVGKGMQSNLNPSDLTPRGKKILETAILESKKYKQELVGTEHILLGLLKEKNCYGVKFLKELGIDISQIERLISDNSYHLFMDDVTKRGSTNKAKQQKDKPYPMIKKYGKDLTEQAKMFKLDPVINRDKEILRVMQILSRRSKNNPCLIGEAGVGKTAIIEGLAQKIVSRNVPENLLDKKIITLDIVSMLAGTKYRGEFEERVKTAIQEACEHEEIILFIDEMHTIVGAGAAEGAIDASNIFKPQLARGEIQIIGATTIDEYRKNIEKDGALERRFQSVLIKEPTKEQTLEILKGLRNRYERYHGLKITDQALEAAVKMSDRYLSDRFFPDKAIDLIDEAAAKTKLAVRKKPVNISALEGKIKELKRQKEIAIASQEFEQAAKLKMDERDIERKIGDSYEQWKIDDTNTQAKIDDKSIAEIVSMMTGIEVSGIDMEESKKLLGMEEKISKKVIGQEKAIKAVCDAIRRGRVGLKDPTRPVGSFLFLGPTGVGKTELCKALAEQLFDSQENLITLDMSEYMDKSSITKMIGSSPGYIGFGEGGQFTEKVRRKPYSVILFDEIEKADRDVYNLLLQILEEGILTDGQGRKVSFKNAVIIMTSNVGARFITDHKYLGFAKDVGNIEEHSQREVMKQLRETFRPEFLNRIDEIVLFNKLGEKEIESISSNLLELVTKKMCELEIGFEFTPNVVKAVSEKGCDNNYGARPLRRYIQNNIENKLADIILRDEVYKKQTIFCDYDDDYSFIVKENGKNVLRSLEKI